MRLKVLKRDGYRYCNCGTAGRLEIDHKRPLSQGGEKYALENLQALCPNCHRKKTDAKNPKWHQKKGMAEIFA